MLHVPLGRQLFSFQNNDGLSPLQCSALLSRIQPFFFTCTCYQSNLGVYYC